MHRKSFPSRRWFKGKIQASHVLYIACLGSGVSSIDAPIECEICTNISKVRVPVAANLKLFFLEFGNSVAKPQVLEYIFASAGQSSVASK